MKYFKVNLNALKLEKQNVFVSHIVKALSNYINSCVAIIKRWLFALLKQDITVFLLGIWYCYSRYMALADVAGADQSLTQIAFTTNLESYLALRVTWLIFLIALSISMAGILVALIFLRNRIRIAIALIGQGSKYVSFIFSSLISFKILISL